MKKYTSTDPNLWNGRKSKNQLYLHEKVKCTDLEKENIVVNSDKNIAILGYACDEGVKRNHGRVGAIEGPDAIRKQLAKMPNHLNERRQLFDIGSIQCSDGKMEIAQANLSEKISLLLGGNIFSIALGGGHDIAYGHYNGIREYVKEKSIGIINFDAHFDLRSNEDGNNSGTPFYQIAQDCKKEGLPFNYLCLGIRKDANDRILFQTANELGARYISNESFSIQHWESVQNTVHQFIEKVDYIYLTIDLDGFSSAYAPGVSAPSPMGFSPDLVLKVLKTIIDSNKLISMDLAELNPTYDRDDQTAKLAASLIHFVMHRL